MKILYIITRLDTGGSSEVVLSICEYFALRKPPVKGSYDVVLIYGGTKKLGLADCLAQLGKLQVRTYYIKELKRNISLVNDFIAFVKIIKIIKKERPEIVHTHTSKAGVLGRWAAFLLRKLSSKLKTVKIIHTPHGHIFYGYYSKLITTMFVFIEKITALITDKLIALTEGEKTESLAYGVGNYKQWSVVHSGVDYSICCNVSHKLEKIKSEFKIANNNVLIGTVARLEPVKGVEYFIDAIKIIIDQLIVEKSDLVSSLKFIIVGDGREKEKLKTKSEKLGVKDKIIFTGMRDDVAELISLMDIYVQPSLNEGMGKTIVLAQLLGKPIVATKVQGIPSVVVDGKTGILVSPRNPKELAEAILKLLKDEQLRKEMSVNASIWIKKVEDGYPQFSIERMVYLLEKLYCEIVRG